MQPTIFIIIGIGVVILTRRFSAIAAGLLALVLTAGIAVWGWFAYDKGQVIGLAGYPLSKPVFLGLVAAWFAMEVFGLRRAVKRRKDSA